MGDFFSRLAERTLGLAPVVQPDLMPVLLPVAESEVVSDALPGLEETFERTAAPARKAAPYDDAGSISQNMSITEIATGAGDGRQSLAQGWDHPVAMPGRVVPALDRQLEPVNQEPGAVASPMLKTQARQDVVELDRNRFNREFKTGEPTSMAQSKPIEVRPTATPTIQISIGTVEIRAVTPAPTAAPQRSAERRGNPRLSLEEYLRQRNEGRR
jgi:hypothetical protein